MELEAKWQLFCSWIRKLCTKMTSACSMLSLQPEKVATIPPFGVWNQDPSQADGFTDTFERAKVERLTPLHKNAPASYNRQTPQSNQEAKVNPRIAGFGYTQKKFTHSTNPEQSETNHERK